MMTMTLTVAIQEHLIVCALTNGIAGVRRWGSSTSTRAVACRWGSSFKASWPPCCTLYHAVRPMPQAQRGPLVRAVADEEGRRIGDAVVS